MITWLFGSSSEFSQNMIKHLDGDVVEFGRSNVSYHPADVKDWIEDNISNLESPDRVIFNINTGMVQELPTPLHDFDSTESFQIFNKWWIDNRNQLFFKTSLVDYLINKKDLPSNPPSQSVQTTEGKLPHTYNAHTHTHTWQTQS